MRFQLTELCPGAIAPPIPESDSLQGLTPAFRVLAEVSNRLTVVPKEPLVVVHSSASFQFFRVSLAIRRKKQVLQAIARVGEKEVIVTHAALGS
jgi:hypothetical protein